ncbi:flagellar biosynthesis protein flhf [hydrocarbon metagenome]|uniref:Flagellar biosynthesis protein FlhF n=1 Tax=hydrocarbon metagenome TaxID=938273 RepID=A0A0W8E557_9ZZZZ
MKIKKYVAKDFKSAIKQAQDEMGSDAIILHTRQLKKNRFLGFLSPYHVEITVAVDENLKVNTDLKREKMFSTLTSLEPKDIPAGKSLETVDLNYSASEDPLLAELQQMKDLMSDIKMKMHEVGVIKGISEPAQHFYQILVNNNVNQDIAMSIVSNIESNLPEQKIDDETWVRDVCINVLQDYISDISPITVTPGKKGHIVFMVGPTGVGKTTTIAKLAANMTFLERKTVALITLDTYRVSAAEQLRTFAEIIGIPISVVFNSTDFKEAVQAYQENDIIFVDTAGRSPRNPKQMEELKSYLNIARPDETILVLSVTTHSQDLINIYRQFAPMKIDKVIFTKLDETYSYGQILNTVYEINKPVAYLTTGQNVPDDIEVPDPLHLASLLLRKDGLA